MAQVALRDVDILETCRANGYPTDKPQTAADALAWATSLGAEFRLEDGRTIPASEIEIVREPAVRRTFSIPANVAPHTPAAPHTTHAPATLTAASPRPVLDDSQTRAPDVRVRSVHEALWDARAKRGERLPFSSYAQGLAAREYLRMLVYQRRGRIAEATACEREFMRLSTEVLGFSGYTSSGATSGAAFVPDVFLPELIRNVEEFGAYSRILAPIRTTSSTLILPRDHGLITISFPDEGAAPTPQVTSPDNVVLRSRKGMAIVRASNELLADAGIDAAAFIFTAMAESIARAIDNSLLRDGARADGTSTPFTGFTARYGTTAPTSAANAVTGGDTALLHTLAHLSQLIGAVNRFSGQAKFVCSAAMWSYVFLRVGQSAGGIVPAMLAAPGQESFAGYPVVVVANEIMNSTADVGSGTYAPGFTAGDAPDVLFGYFERAAKLMIQQDIELDFSDQVRFEHDQGVFRVRARWDVNVHDVGSAASRGPVACLWQT